MSDQTNLTSFGVLALRAAAVPVPPKTLDWLLAQQDQDGGFNYATKGGASDVDDTGAVLEAIAGQTGSTANRVRRQAVAFIVAQQNRDGGFPSASGEGSNAQSTAWAVQGLIANGVDPASVHRRGAPSPIGYLSSLRAPDGHIRYSKSSDQTPVWVTAEAMMALAGKPLPLSRPPMGAVTSSPRPTHHKPARQSRAAEREGRRVHAARAAAVRAVSSGVTIRLASYAGILDAVALAPIGVG